MNNLIEIEENLYKKIVCQCPVCGFDWKERYPESAYSIEGYESNIICPSCGVQFGYDDSFKVASSEEDGYKIYGNNHLKRLAELRLKWIGQSMTWWSSSFQPPENWNPIEQLKNIPEEFLDQETKEFIKSHSSVK